MFTKKALIDEDGRVLDVRPIGLEYPSTKQWVPCPAETNTDWVYNAGEFTPPQTTEKPAEPPAVLTKPPVRLEIKLSELEEKLDLTLAAVSVLLGQQAAVKDETGAETIVTTPVEMATVLSKRQADILAKEPVGQADPIG